MCVCFLCRLHRLAAPSLIQSQDQQLLETKEDNNDKNKSTSSRSSNEDSSWQQIGHSNKSSGNMVLADHSNRDADIRGKPSARQPPPPPGSQGETFRHTTSTLPSNAAPKLSNRDGLQQHAWIPNRVSC